MNVNSTEPSLGGGGDVNRSTPIYTIGTSFITQWLVSLNINL